MDVIPFVRFVGSIIFAGFMLYIFFAVMPVITGIDIFAGAVATDYYVIMAAAWNALPFIVLIREAILFLMTLQKREGIH